MLFQNVDFFTAFAAGLALFFTPCTLPLIPGWLAAVTGREYGELLAPDAAPPARLRLGIFLSTVFFSAGFSLVFTLLGAAAGALGGFLYDYSFALRVAGGAVLALFALILLGVIKPERVMGERRLRLSREPAGLLGAFVIGVAFAAGWTPCSGPVLAAILALAAHSESARGMRLLAVFSLGLALPFLALSLFLSRVLRLFKRAAPLWPAVSKALGVLFLILAALLITGRLSLITPDYQVQ